MSQAINDKGQNMVDAAEKKKKKGCRALRGTRVVYASVCNRKLRYRSFPLHTLACVTFN